jgi:hypothetical protein
MCFNVLVIFIQKRHRGKFKAANTKAISVIKFLIELYLLQAFNKLVLCRLCC